MATADLAKKFQLFCFTDYERDLSFWDKKKLNWRYIIIGDEICPTTGRQHWQGFIYFKNQRHWNAVRKLLSPRHVNICKGSAQENITYCSKDGNIILEDGDRPSQGQRTDLNEVKNEILDGRSVDDICVENPMVFHQYGRTLERLETIALRKKFRTRAPTVTWYIRGTFNHRSQCAFGRYNPENVYIWQKESQWQDGYTGQKKVVISEFNGEISGRTLLEMFSSNPFHIQRRGREPIPFTSSVIILTSQEYPDIILGDKCSTETVMEIISGKCHIIDLAEKCSEGNTRSSEPGEESS